jgi:Protein ENHANCED DISEASE RESISTANCE 2, C-terminal
LPPQVAGDGVLPQGDFRNERFKLIPSIVEGPFLVRRSVGAKPALLGRKLTQRYFRGPNYVETDVDVSSSSIAEKVRAAAYRTVVLVSQLRAAQLRGDRR